MNIEICKQLMQEVKEKRTTVKEAHSVMDMLYSNRVICYRKYRYMVQYINCNYERI